jgi:predicted amidohydrolase
MKVTLIQINSQDDKNANVAEAVRLIRAAVQSDHPDLVILPEYFACLHGDPAKQRASGEAFPTGPACRALSGLARELDVFIHAGSMVETSADRSFNTTIVFGRDGEPLATYRKIHLFDVVVPGGVKYLESDTVSRGSEIVTYKAGDVVVGCSICYDLRFPELYRKLRDAGADVIAVPAAFTAATGKDHWEVLLRARAIETQTYVLAAAQVGTHAGGKKACWGHSMVIDPWGHIIAQASDRVGYVTAQIDPSYTAQIRASIPVDQHHVLD